MAGLIAVSPELLSSVSSRLSDGARTIEDTLASLAAAVAPLAEEWAGSGQSGFDEAWRDWRRDAVALHESLLGLVEMTGRAASTYESTEAAVVASFRR